MVCTFVSLQIMLCDKNSIMTSLRSWFWSSTCWKKNNKKPPTNIQLSAIYKMEGDLDGLLKETWRMCLLTLSGHPLFHREWWVTEFCACSRSVQLLPGVWPWWSHQSHDGVVHVPDGLPHWLRMQLHEGKLLRYLGLCQECVSCYGCLMSRVWHQSTQDGIGLVMKGLSCWLGQIHQSVQRKFPRASDWIRG